MAVPSNWFTDALEKTARTKDPRKIARKCGELLSESPQILEIIQTAIDEDREENTGRPWIEHAIAMAIARSISPTKLDDDNT